MEISVIDRKILPNNTFSSVLTELASIILNSTQKDIIKKIYLFGSYAYGYPTKKSDIDLCVVIDDNADRKNVFMDISMKLLENNIANFDLLVYKKEIFYNVKNKDSVENTIINEGIILYE